MTNKVDIYAMQHVTCDLLSNGFNFHLKLLNSVLVGVVHMIFE